MAAKAGWERARSPAQKEQRRREILEAAAGLLRTRSFGSITLSHIAAELSFSRANLYKYFRTRDEVFLAVLASQIEEFGESLTRSEATTSLAECWTTQLADQQLMLMLLTVVGTVLEKDCSDEALLASKRVMASAVEEHFLPYIGRFYPSWENEQRTTVLNMLMVTAAGLYPMCGLSESQRSLLQHNGLGSMVHDFEPTYLAMVRAQLA